MKYFNIWNFRLIIQPQKLLPSIWNFAHLIFTPSTNFPEGKHFEIQKCWFSSHPLLKASRDLGLVMTFCLEEDDPFLYRLLDTKRTLLDHYIIGTIRQISFNSVNEFGEYVGKLFMQDNGKVFLMLRLILACDGNQTRIVRLDNPPLYH